MTKEGVMIIMFDLPMVNGNDRRNYSQFMKLLKRNAYRQLQESVYVKHIRNISTAKDEVRKLKAEAPEMGRILAFNLTKIQYESVAVVRGGEVPLVEYFQPVMDV